MVIGMGLDLVEESRVARMLERWGDRIVQKIMGPDEARTLPSEPGERVRALAHAIALKEAASKSIGTGWSQGVRWRDVVTRLGPPPEVSLEARAQDVARARGSSGRARVFLDRRGDLILGEVWLLS